MYTENEEEYVYGEARYSYEGEMEYLYAVKERYDPMRAETLERERQQQVTEQLERERKQQVETGQSNEVGMDFSTAENLWDDGADPSGAGAPSKNDDPDHEIPEPYAQPISHYSEWPLLVP